MKKVLLLIANESSFKKPIGTAFKGLDWNIKFYDYRKGDIFVRILRFLPLIGGFDKAREAINKRIQNIGEEYKPDLILVNKGEIIPDNVIQSLKKNKTRVVNLFPEYLNYWKLAKKLSGIYDIFLVFDYPLLDKLKKNGRKNAFYLPFGAEIEKKSNFKKEYDVSFVGTYRKSRENTLSKLTGFDLHIWGDPRWYKSSLARFVEGGRISQKKMKEIIKKSKINLNIYFSGFKLDGVALRVFEVTGCGEFLLSEFKNSLTKLYKIDKEIVTSKNPRDMVSKIKFYLKNDTLRKKIALAGYKRAKKDHNWIKRIKTLESIIKKHPNRVQIS